MPLHSGHQGQVSQAFDLVLKRGAEDLLVLKAEVPTRVPLPVTPL